MTIFAITLYCAYLFSYVVVITKMGLKLFGPNQQMLQEAEKIGRGLSWAIASDKYRSNPMGTFIGVFISVAYTLVFPYLSYLLFKNYLPNDFFGGNLPFDNKLVYLAVFWGGIAFIYSQSLGNYIQGYFEHKRSPMSLN